MPVVGTRDICFVTVVVAPHCHCKERKKEKPKQTTRWLEVLESIMPSACKRESIVTDLVIKMLSLDVSFGLNPLNPPSAGLYGHLMQGNNRVT